MLKQVQHDRNKMNQKISILGCGWLGFPLAEKLIENGFEVKGSTTSGSKLDLLKNAGILSFQIQLEEHQITGNIEDFLKKSDVLFINIPPGLRSKVSSSVEMIFVNKVKTLIPFIEKSGIQKVIFVSSTSVYGDSFPIVEITEETKPNPDTQSGKQLVEAELLLRSNVNFQTTIIRFGGLIGVDRHPVKFLAGKESVENPDAPINLIHQEDCIGIIEEILKQVQHNNWGETFNAVAPQHPTRQEYYHKKAENLKLPFPNFAKKLETQGKLISSTKVETVLQYSFRKKV